MSVIYTRNHMLLVCCQHLKNKKKREKRGESPLHLARTLLMRSPSLYFSTQYHIFVSPYRMKVMCVLNEQLVDEEVFQPVSMAPFVSPELC